MKTAVNQMIKELQEQFQKEMGDMYERNQLLLEDIALRAKEMEKNQLSHFYSCGTFDEYSRNVRNAEELYNETFKQQEQ
jgi:hypothetical protein